MMETLAAAQDAVAGYSITKLAIAIVAVLVATKAFGWLVSRAGQSGSLGEIIGGVIVGGSVLGLVDPHDPIIHALSQAGMVILLFSAGMHTQPAALLRPASGARAVATIGWVVPFALGLGATYSLGFTWLEAIIAGAALGATAVFVASRTLGQLGLLDSEEGRIVQGAAVLDDVISLAVIAVIMALVTGSSTPADLIVRTLLLPGAFIAGLLFGARGLRTQAEWVTSRLYWVFAPFFFAAVGASLDLHVFLNGRTLGIAGALVVLGVIGKLAAGWGAPASGRSRLLVGAAMIPRGAMGLIFAQVGWNSGALEGALFAGVVVLVFVTTIITPPVLRIAARRAAIAPRQP